MTWYGCILQKKGGGQKSRGFPTQIHLQQIPWAIQTIDPP